MAERFSELEYHARSARSVNDKISAVEAIQEWPTLEAIPLLGQIDRRATGWLVSLTGWLAVTLWVLFATACLLVFWLALWVLGIQTSVQLVDRLHPGLGAWITAAGILLAFVVLPRDSRLRTLVGERLSPDLEDIPFLLALGIKAARVLFYMLAVLVAGALLYVIALAVVVTLADWGLWLARDADTLAPYFSALWPVGLGTTLLVALAVVGLRSIWRKTIPLLVGACVGVWGLVRLVMSSSTLYPEYEQLTAGIILGAVVLYRTPLTFALARAMTLPLKWFTDNTRRLAQRLRLRKLLWTVVREHRRRNVSRIGKKWKLALCSNCYARFELQQERLAYRRRLRYASCRICHLDQPCYQGVNRAQGWLDHKMEDEHEQVGSAVRVNLLPYLTNRHERLPFDLDSIVVSEASDHEVEGFLTLYQERGRDQAVRPLGDLSYWVEPSSEVGPNIRAMLKDTFVKEEHP